MSSTVVKIGNNNVFIVAKISSENPSIFDYMALHFGPLAMLINDATERKAFIAALQSADAELDAAAERKGKEAA